MSVLITIGPTQEPLDAMRLLSNRSTGRLGTLLASILANAGHQVVALRGTGCTVATGELEREGIRIVPFTTTEDLRRTLEQISTTEQVTAVFHAAAVCDFYLPGAGSGKIPSLEGSLTLTLEPTPKLLPKMHDWFPKATIIGWKFEASGSRIDAISAAKKQITACSSDVCVLNGPSYGKGFGVLGKEGHPHHCEDREGLCQFLAGMLL
jgi:phosphopantothenoylcysteine decarboxylase/phosphopantothenate--cysteine ligase